MSDATPGHTPAAAPVSTAPVILRIILATLLLIPGIVGILVLAFWVAAWGYEGFTFTSSDREWVPLFIIPSVVLILFSAASVGIVLRFARWRKAPMASLVLAVVSVIAIVMGYQLMLDSFTPDDTESPTMALVGSIVALIVISGPLFLHWWNAHRTAEPPRN